MLRERAIKSTEKSQDQLGFEPKTFERKTDALITKPMAEEQHTSCI